MSDDREYAQVNGTVGEVLARTEANRGVYVLPEGTRFEIYGKSGGMKHAVTVEPGATIHVQDNGRTLKIFTNEHVEPGAWFQENHDWGQRQRASNSAADKE